MFLFHDICWTELAWVSNALCAESKPTKLNILKADSEKVERASLGETQSADHSYFDSKKPAVVLASP